MKQQTEKICFRYDGSPEAIEAYRVWDDIGIIRVNKPDFGFYYLSNGTGYTNFEPRPNEYRLVTPAEFLRLVKGESQWTPKYGEEVEVSDDGEVWNAGYYCCPNPHHEKKDEYPHCVIIKENRSGGGGSYKHIRPVRKSVREEVCKLIAENKGPLETVADRIIQLVKERRNEL